MASKALTGNTVGEVLSGKLEAVTQRLDGMDGTLLRVSESLVALVRLEERHEALSREQARLTEQLIDHHKRLAAVELDIPSLKETRRWIILGILGVCALVGVGMFNGYLISQQKPVVVQYLPPAVK